MKVKVSRELYNSLSLYRSLIHKAIRDLLIQIEDKLIKEDPKDDTIDVCRDTLALSFYLSDRNSPLLEMDEILKELSFMDMEKNLIDYLSKKGFT